MTEDKFFKVLFDENDYFCRGHAKARKVHPVFPAQSGYEFFTVNPLDSKIDHAHFVKDYYDKDTPRRADLNVTCFRNFVFEMDGLSLESQIILLKNCKIPWATITYSGGKSLHAILSLEVPLDLEPHKVESIIEYKRIWRRICAFLEQKATEYELCKKGEKVIDYSCCNPSRFTRYPCSLRVDKNDIQKVMNIGYRISPVEFRDLLDKCPQVASSLASFEFETLEGELETLNEFFNAAPSGLRNEIKYVRFGGDSGMYPEMYRVTKWAMRDANVSYNLMIELLEEFIIPELITTYRYYDKSCKHLYLAVEHAFKDRSESNV